MGLPIAVLSKIRPIDQEVGDEERIEWDQMQWSTPGLVVDFWDAWIDLRCEWSKVVRHE
jgi:hypothetical protein